MILNIRGTSGSGKTTLVRKFFELCDDKRDMYIPDRKKPIGYECNYKGEIVFVLGSYENNCGGCDTIKTQDQITQLVDDLSMEGHVLFEGLFISHIYGRYAELAKQHEGEFVFIMLETDFDKCMEHIKTRREATGNMEELKDTVYKNAGNTYRATYRIREKLTNEGIPWEELPLENRFELFEDMLDFHLGVKDGQ